MTARKLLQFIMLLLILPVSGALARTNTPIETFIQHVRSNNTFVPVTNIWQPDELFDKTAMLQKVADAQPLTIDYTAINSLLQANHTAISLVVPGINGTTYTIDLAQYKFFSSDFEIHAKGANNVDSAVSYTPGLYYSGVVHGIPGSVASFSFFKNEVYGVFSIPGVGNFNVVPNTMVGKYYDYNQHYVLFNDKDLKINEHAPKCATDQLPRSHYSSSQRTTTTANNNVYNNCTEVRVFEVGDYALYLTKGSSITNVTNYLTSLFNNQATIYRNEGVLIVLKYLQVDNASDAWHGITTANSILFLDKFGYITGNVLHGCDLAILASTCLNGGYGALGGVAWVKELCKTYYAPDSAGPYAFCDMDNSGVTGFPTYSWDVEVICHEMGHVVGSPHTHACCWNPPARNTAIDACYTLEGSCATPSPAYPTGGGTVMSYCHLVSGVGINLANGFGPQPGDTIRYFINYQFSHVSGCGATYTPTVALASANRTVAANRECTDMTSGITYYWNDHNTADQTDDTLVLMLKKNGNNIGNLNTSGFTVSANTIVRYGTGVGDTITSFPAGTPGLGGRYYGMRRYWKINATTAPSTAVEVMFPFLLTDTADVSGSVPGAAPLSSYLFYKANSPVDPNPISGFPGSATSDFIAYTYSTTASANHWSFSTAGSTYLAHMLMTNLSGGGTGIFTACPALAAPTLSTSVTAPCTGTTNTYAVTPIAGALSYNWSVTGTGWSGSSTTNSISLNTGTGNAVISVSANDTCGAGTAYTFTITPSAIPTEVIVAPATVCVGSSTSVFTTTSTGVPTSYTWTVSGAGWSGASTGATITPVVGSGVGTLVVQCTNACGTGPAYTLNVTPETVPSAATTIIAPTGGLCSGNLVTYSTPSVSGATSYTWTIDGSGWSGSSTTSSINVTVGTGTATITVTPINECGSGASFSLYGITPVAAPTADFSASTLTTTSHTNVIFTYTGAAPGGTTYSWTFPGGTPPSSTSAGPVSVYWNTPGTYTVTLTVQSDGCSATTTETIVVNAAVSVPGSTTGKVSAGIVPNPNDGSFDVVFDHAISSVVTVKLYDVMGRVVYKNDLTAANNNKLTISAADLPAGTYAATIYFDGNMIAEKITIKK